MTIEDALQTVIAGLSQTNDLTDKYIVLCNSTGELVNTVRADNLHLNDYGYIIVGTL